MLHSIRRTATIAVAAVSTVAVWMLTGPTPAAQARSSISASRKVPVCHPSGRCQLASWAKLLRARAFSSSGPRDDGRLRQLI